MKQKSGKSVLFFRQLHLNWLRQILTIVGKYLSSTVNMLTNKLKILHIQTQFSQNDEKYDTSAAMDISEVCRNL